MLIRYLSVISTNYMRSFKDCILWTIAHNPNYMIVRVFLFKNWLHIFCEATVRQHKFLLNFSIIKMQIWDLTCNEKVPSYSFKNTAFYPKYDYVDLDTKQNCTLVNTFFGNAILKAAKKKVNVLEIGLLVAVFLLSLHYALYFIEQINEHL